MGSDHLIGRDAPSEAATHFLLARSAHESRAETIARVIATLFELRGLTAGDVSADVIAVPGDMADAIADGDGLLAARTLGATYEHLLAPAERRTRGAHFTPFDVAQRLVAFALGEVDVDDAFRICDPTCGGGVFLLAFAEALLERGFSRPRALNAIHGAEIDPLGVAVSRAALTMWLGEQDVSIPARVVEADALVDDGWDLAGFDAVVGNPPFQNQLERSTVRSAGARRAGSTLGAAKAPYVDTAALFLVRALQLAREGGCVAMIQPQSTLVARDAAAVRTMVHERAELTGLWYATDAIFSANVRVCAPVLVRREQPRGVPPLVKRTRDRSFTQAEPCSMPSDGSTWAGLVSDLLGIPAVSLRGDRRLGDIATATAGFRDEYYGLVGAIEERRAGPDEPRLMTCGLIDLLGCAWGERPATFARTRYREPVVLLDRLSGRVAKWVEAQLVPKLLVATQSKVIEVFVDERGLYVPSTPVIAVHAPADQLWHVAAALSAPCVTAHAFARFAGAALGAQALKLAARQVLDLPLPIDHKAWDRGAQLARSVQLSAPDERSTRLDQVGAVMNAAYESVDAAVLHWWSARR